MSITYDDLVTVFPVFATTDPARLAQINFYINLATARTDANFYGSDYTLAVLYTVADSLAVADFASSSGGMTSGKISARSVDGEYTVTYGSRASTSSVQSGRSSYAELLADLTNRIGLGASTLDCCFDGYYGGDGLPAIPVPPVVPAPSPTPTPIPPSSFVASAETDTACIVGNALYMKANGHVDLARANNIATTKVCGLALTAASPTFSTNFDVDGIIELADWTAIAGTALLTPGATYFLSESTEGMISAIAPSVGFIAAIGSALTTTRLQIEIQPIVRL